MFLPVTYQEMTARGWDAPDFVYVCGDAYVDHPSFGAAIISRVLEHAGFRVAMLPQPDFHTCDDFKRFGRPRLGFLVSAGNLDSMVAHYTVSGHRRTYDYYSPGGKPGRRPDRAVIVYTNRIREAYGDVPVILGGLEASLRRFAHYDYWSDRLRRSVLLDSGADLLTYGMGENILLRVASLLDRGIPISKLRDVRGTVFVGRRGDPVHYPVSDSFSFEELQGDKRRVAEAFAAEYRSCDACYGTAIVEYYGDRMLVQNPPMPPLEQAELDAVYALPYERAAHPMYQADGGVPGLAEVQFSITHNRGCFGGCNFCALAFHQGRQVRARSRESVVKEAELLTSLPDFKGYIHDVGGPTANFRRPSCEKQRTEGMCKDRHCLTPTPCPALRVDHTEYAALLRAVADVPGVKKVFVRSGIRFDYLLADHSPGGRAFFEQLVLRHVSGQLKVAPEHCSPDVLRLMGKCPAEVFETFRTRYFSLCEKNGLSQFLVPYLMSSHPGSTLQDAVTLALWIHKWGYQPEQVQDFYPTPGTASTVMFYTGIDPFTGKEVYVPRDPHEKRMQRALLQPSLPKNASLAREALRLVHREDLIGYGPDCLVRPASTRSSEPQSSHTPGSHSPRSSVPQSSRSSASQSSRSSASQSSRFSAPAKQRTATSPAKKTKRGNPPKNKTRH